MKAEVLAHFHLTWMTCAALILFFSLFVGTLIWIFRRGSTDYYKNAAQLPFLQD